MNRDALDPSRGDVSPVMTVQEQERISALQIQASLGRQSDCIRNALAKITAQFDAQMSCAQRLKNEVIGKNEEIMRRSEGQLGAMLDVVKEREKMG